MRGPGCEWSERVGPPRSPRGSAVCLDATPLLAATAAPFLLYSCILGAERPEAQGLSEAGREHGAGSPGEGLLIDGKFPAVSKGHRGFACSWHSWVTQLRGWQSRTGVPRMLRGTGPWEETMHLATRTRWEGHKPGPSLFTHRTSPGRDLPAARTSVYDIDGHVTGHVSHRLIVHGVGPPGTSTGLLLFLPTRWAVACSPT